MADATLNKNIRFDSDKVEIGWWALDNSEAQSVLRGEPLTLDMNVDTLYAQRLLAADTPATNDVFLGVAAEPASIKTTDTEGEVGLRVIERGVVGFPNNFSFTNADVGKSVYWSDSATLTTTATGNVLCGPITRVRDGYVYVRLSAPAVLTIT